MTLDSPSLSLCFPICGMGSPHFPQHLQGLNEKAEKSSISGLAHSRCSTKVGFFQRGRWLCCSCSQCKKGRERTPLSPQTLAKEGESGQSGRRDTTVRTTTPAPPPLPHLSRAQSLASRLSQPHLCLVMALCSHPWLQSVCRRQHLMGLRFIIYFSYCAFPQAFQATLTGR